MGTYNGWTNYETWNFALWADNDNPNYWQERAEELASEFDKDEIREGFTLKEEITFLLADEMQELTEENAPNEATGFYADIMNAAIRSINWHEVAAHYCDEIEEPEPEEEEAK
jgi:hypothetical protein